MNIYSTIDLTNLVYTIKNIFSTLPALPQLLRENVGNGFVEYSQR